MLAITGQSADSCGKFGTSLPEPYGAREHLTWVREVLDAAAGGLRFEGQLDRRRRGGGREGRAWREYGLTDVRQHGGDRATHRQQTIRRRVGGVLSASLKDLAPHVVDYPGLEYEVEQRGVLTRRERDELQLLCRRRLAGDPLDNRRRKRLARLLAKIDPGVGGLVRLPSRETNFTPRPGDPVAISATDGAMTAAVTAVASCGGYPAIGLYLGDDSTGARLVRPFQFKKGI